METDRISSATESPDGTTKELAITQTLGTLQLRHVDTNQIILIPTPSSDPADPLNWYDPCILSYSPGILDGIRIDIHTTGHKHANTTSPG